MSNSTEREYAMRQKRGIYGDGSIYITAMITELEESTFNGNPCYYIKAGLEQGGKYYLSIPIYNELNSTQTYFIKLCKDDKILQTLKTVEILAKQTKNIEVIFSPREDGLTVTLELFNKATTKIEREQNSKINIVKDEKGNYKVELYKIKNIIESDNERNIKRIGIHGTPGLLFTLDGAEIRIGRTGVYEIYNDDIEINDIGFVIKDPGHYFIIDYKCEVIGTSETQGGNK